MLAGTVQISVSCAPCLSSRSHGEAAFPIESLPISSDQFYYTVLHTYVLMNDLIAVLTILIILLTAVGTFRFGARFYGSSLIAGLLAGSVTVAFIIVIDFYLLLMGLLPLVAATVGVMRYIGDDNPSDQDPPSNVSRSNKICQDCGREEITDNQFCDRCNGVLVNKRR